MDEEDEEDDTCFTIQGFHANPAPLFSGANISVEASYCALLQYAVTNHLSFNALSQLIELIKIHCPQAKQVYSKRVFTKEAL